MARTEAQRAAVAVLAAALALAVAGCLGSDSDKAGGAQHQKPVVLTMANGTGSALELEPFEAAVARLSNNTVRIEFKNNWRQGSPSVETGVIRDVEAGKADLGWTGSRAFDSVGVRTLDALHAPLLIDSYALEQRVLQSPLVGDMLDGLKPLGVVGIGVLPGPMRKPLGVSPLVRPEDYRGKTIAIGAVTRCAADAPGTRRERHGDPGRRRDRSVSTASSSRSVRSTPTSTTRSPST